MNRKCIVGCGGWGDLEAPTPALMPVLSVMYDRYTFRSRHILYTVLRSEGGRQLGKETFRLAKQKMDHENGYYFHYGSKLPRISDLNRAIT